MTQISKGFVVIGAVAAFALSANNASAGMHAAGSSNIGSGSGAGKTVQSGIALNFSHQQFRFAPQGSSSNHGSANIGTGYNIGANKPGSSSNQGSANIGTGYNIGANRPGH